MMIKMYSGVLIFLFWVVGAGCNQQPSAVQLFKDHMNRKIDLSGYDFVYGNGRSYSYAEFRINYPFVTVNYIDEDCIACKVKLREWCDNAHKVPTNENLAHLFVFRGRNHQTFIKYSQGEIEFPFYIMPREEFTFVNNNKKINRQIIDAGFLLNKKDRIQIIGDPFISDKLTNLYYSVVKER